MGPGGGAVNLHGYVRLQTRNKSGLVTHEWEGPNLLCNAGVSTLVAEISQTGYQYRTTFGAVGTGTAAPTDSDTTLTAEVARAPVSAPVASGEAWSWQFFFNPYSSTSNLDIYECGVFLAATATANSGMLLDHIAQTTPLIEWNAGETLMLQVTFTVS